MKPASFAASLIAFLALQGNAMASQPLPSLPELKEKFRKSVENWHNEVSRHEGAISECATNDVRVRQERLRLFREVPRYLGNNRGTAADIRSGDGYLHFLKLNARVMNLSQPLGETGGGLAGLAGGVRGRIGELQQISESITVLWDQIEARTQFLRNKSPVFEIRPDQQHLRCEQQAFDAFQRAKGLSDELLYTTSLVRSHANQLRKRWERIGAVLDEQLAGRKSALAPAGPGGICGSGQFLVPELGMCQVNELKPRPRHAQ